MLSRPEFLFELARRRILERHIGSSIVVLWVVLAPLIPLATNLAVFYFIAKIPTIQSMGVVTYAVYIFSGLLPFRIMQSSVAEASELLVGNMEMLKSVSFPISYLSMAAVAALMLEFGIQSVLMLVLLLVSGTGVTLHILWLPFAVVLLVVFLLGLSWAVSVVAYFFRDLREILGVAFSVLLYLSPVMYPLAAVPPLMKEFITLNPISHFVIIFRDALLPMGDSMHWDSWFFAAVMATLAFGIGGLAIHRTRLFVGDMV